jgi:transcription initiation factor TFIID TATA-box-binding protein
MENFFDDDFEELLAKSNANESKEANDHIADLQKILSMDIVPTIEELPSTKSPEVHNIVATVNLKSKIDCHKVALHVNNSKYNSRRFPGVILMLKDPKSTALVFPNGKMNVLGTKTEDDAVISSRKFALMVKKSGHSQVKWSEFKIVNILASANAGFKINLEKLAIDSRHLTNFEPEIFAGLIYRVLDPKITFLIFTSGKMVILGKVREEIHVTFQKMLPVLKEFAAVV